MAQYDLRSWNVNGIRAAQKKGLLEWLKKEKPQILALQETKAHPEQLDDKLLNVDGYHACFNSAIRKGYSGVALYSREKPENIAYGFGNKQFDTEGRTLIAEYEKFILLNIYFPNGGSGPERLKFKLDFYREFFNYLRSMKKKKPVIICGDFNTAHNEIDLARPKENSKVSGFLPVERALLEDFIGRGFVDTFRYKHEKEVAYSWWDYKTRARERDVGWRIDYFFIDKKSVGIVKKAFIKKDVYGSDHCPVGITVTV